MSFRLIPLAWDADLNPIEKLILLKLADCANDDGSGIRPGRGAIERDCGASESTVKRTLRHFIQIGILTLTSRSKGRGSANVYRLNIHAITLLKKGGHTEPVHTEPVHTDPKGGHTDPPPLIPLKKEKKYAGAREGQAVVAVNPAVAGATSLSEDDITSVKDSIRAWAKERRPDLPFDDTFDDWRDHCIVNGIEFDSQEQAKAMARGWFRRASGRTRPKSKDSANPVKNSACPKVTFSDQATDSDRITWSKTANIFSERFGTQVWGAWFSKVPFLGVIGSTALLEMDPKSALANYIRNHLNQQIEAALSEAAQRKITIQFPML